MSQNTGEKADVAHCHTYLQLLKLMHILYNAIFLILLIKNVMWHCCGHRRSMSLYKHRAKCDHIERWSISVLCLMLHISLCHTMLTSLMDTLWSFIYDICLAEIFWCTLVVCLWNLMTRVDVLHSYGRITASVLLMLMLQLNNMYCYIRVSWLILSKLLHSGPVIQYIFERDSSVLDLYCYISSSMLKHRLMTRILKLFIYVCVGCDGD